MYHIFILLAFLFGCKEADDSKIELKKYENFDKLEENLQLPEVKKDLKNEWHNKISITLNENVSVAEVLKNVANKLGIKITWNIKNPVYINYSAHDKRFIEILADIGQMCDLKIVIKDLNCKITADGLYFNNYEIAFLTGERKSVHDLNYSNNFELKSGSSSKILSNTLALDLFAELHKNIEMILQCENNPDIKFSINKQAGILTLYASQKIHRAVMRYLKNLIRKINLQVLIQAKIYEVRLFNHFSTGIDLAKAFSAIFGVGNPTFQGTGLTGLSLSSKGGYDEGLIIDVLNKFGFLKSIANPRLMVMNNNIGIFKSVKNEVIFKLKRERTVFEKNKKANYADDTYSSEMQNIPVGTIFTVQPTINDDNKITIALKPTISEIYETIEDPAFALMKNKLKDVKSSVPIMQIKELDTTFTLFEGQTVIIGGLLYVKKEQEVKGFYTGYKNLSDVHEVIIFMQANIIKDISYEDYDHKVFIEN